MKRRDFLKQAVVGAGVVGLGGASGFAAQAEETKTFFPYVFKPDFSDVRGFMYEPSYAWTEVDVWHHFDPKIINLELSRGKKYFPGLNALRISLSADAYKRNPARFLSNLDRYLDIAAGHGLAVTATLFNRWHDSALDFGGIYVDNFWRGEKQYRNVYSSYVKAVISKFAGDKRIFLWDVANEPLHEINRYPDIFKMELDWLGWIYQDCKVAGAQAPLCVGLWGECRDCLEKVEPISDVLTIHSYLSPYITKERFVARLEGWVDLARRSKKPLLITESCWGADTDAKRVENMRFEFGEHKKRNLGFFAVMLHWSYRIDCHDASDGLPVGHMQNLEFIKKDGTLREGHEVFNEF
jgi:hypothetical protein